MLKISKALVILPLFILTSCTAQKSIKSHKSFNQVLVQENKMVAIPQEPPIHSKDLLIKNNNKYCYSLCPDIDLKVNQLINQNDFIVSYNTHTKYADWVAYKIAKSKISGPTKKRIWKADPQITEELALKPSDYKGAYITCNYDRGHQAPLADFSNSDNWDKTNYLSNITPQKAALNRGPWNNLEKKIREIANVSKNDLYVLTGTYYNGRPVCKLPRARIANTIPNGYWKVITFVANNNVYRASFKLEQDVPKNANFCDFNVKFQDLNKLLTYSLNLGPNTENSQMLLNMLGCFN